MAQNGRSGSVVEMTSRSELAREWLLMNPEGGLRECAAALGLSHKWLAQVVASDSFQAAYALRCQALGREGIFLVKQRTQALQMLAVERGIELLQEGKASERFVLEVAKTALVPQGGSGGGANGLGHGTEQHLHLHVNAADLAEARRLAAAQLQMVPKKAGGARAQGAQTLQVLSTGEEGGREAPSLASFFNQEEEAGA